MDPIVIAGLLMSGYGTLSTLKKDISDFLSWREEDLLVDSAWLPMAIAKGYVPGKLDDYAFSRLFKVPARELNGEVERFFFFDKTEKIKYRVVTKDSPPSILVKKLK